MSVNAVNSDGSLSKIAGGINTNDTDIIKSDLSYVEPYTTATVAHAQGDCFVMNTGQLVRATSAINIGDTITLNTNVSAVSIIELLANKVDKVAGKDLSTNDYTDMDKAKVGKIDETTTHISDNPISISGLKSNQLAINPVITFEPIQAGSGTPSPVNQRPISGYDKIEVLSCGKNLITDTPYSGSYNAAVGTSLKVTANMATYTQNNNIITLNVPTAWYCKLWATNILGAGTYRFRCSFGDSNVRATLYVTDESLTVKSVVQNIQAGGQSAIDVTLTETSRIAIAITKNVTGTETITDMVVVLGTDTTYEPYTPATSISESLGQTVYWGELEDARSGKFKVIGKMIDLGDLTWIYNSAYDKFYAQTVTDALKAEGKTCVCSRYLAVDNVDSISDTMPNKSINMMSDPSSPDRIYIYDTDYDDGTALKTALVGTQFVYKLATPFYIQLTPHEISLLKDYAYVSTNGTNITLDYHNGELASLGDVSQLGETVNELGEYLPNIFETLFVRRMKVALNNNIPTAEELASLSFPESGIWVVDFNNASYTTNPNEVHSTLIYSRSSRNYGAGILFSYYSSGVISYVRNNNNVWTISPITHT